MRILTEDGSRGEAKAVLWETLRLKLDTMASRDDVDYLTRTALVASISKDQSPARETFLRSLVVSAVTHGLWHRSALDTLFHWGRSLRLWGQHRAAVPVLSFCCHGLAHTFGASHPLTERAVGELRRCDCAVASVQKLLCHIHGLFTEKRQMSLSFEAFHVTTLIDILTPTETELGESKTEQDHSTTEPDGPMIKLDYLLIERELKAMMERSSDKISWIHFRRLKAQCAFKDGENLRSIGNLA